MEGGHSMLNIEWTLICLNNYFIRKESGSFLAVVIIAEQGYL